MRLEFEVGDGERHRVTVVRLPWLARVRLEVDGRRIAEECDVFHLKMVETYRFSVGVDETHSVTIEHERPAPLSWIRPHRFRAFVDDELVAERSGY